MTTVISIDFFGFREIVDNKHTIYDYLTKYYEARLAKNDDHNDMIKMYQKWEFPNEDKKLEFILKYSGAILKIENK